jgi:hypothetical protein
MVGRASPLRAAMNCNETALKPSRADQPLIAENSPLLQGTKQKKKS